MSKSSLEVWSCELHKNVLEFVDKQVVLGLEGQRYAREFWDITGTNYHGISIYTLPNMSFVLEFHVGKEKLHAQADSYFVPQLFYHTFSYIIVSLS